MTEQTSRDAALYLDSFITSPATLGGRVELEGIVYEWSAVDRAAGEYELSIDKSELQKTRIDDFPTPLKEYLLDAVAQARITAPHKEINELKKRVRKAPSIDVELNDEIQALLSRYGSLVKHCVNGTIGTHKHVSWNIEQNPVFHKATISYQEGKQGEWQDDLYPESVPAWLLLHLLTALKKRMPLGKIKEQEIIRASESALERKTEIEPPAVRLNFFTREGSE